MAIGTDPTKAESSSEVKAAPSIGVILPVYNRVHVVREALQSVASQSLLPKRIVVVDDGSNDGSHEAVEAFFREICHIETRLIRQPNAGVSAARNRAARELLDCDLLAMIDSDDLWPEGYLKAMTEPFSESNTELIATFCDQDFVDLKTGETRHRDLTIYGQDTTRRMYLYGPPTPSCTVLRQDIFQKSGGYREDLLAAEDYALHLALSLVGGWRHIKGLRVQMRRSIDHHAENAKHLTSIKNLFFDVSRTRMLEDFGRANSRAVSNKPWVWRRFASDLWAGLAAGQIDSRVGQVAATMYWRAFCCAPWRIGFALTCIGSRFKYGSADLDRLMRESFSDSKPRHISTPDEQQET